MHTQAKGQSMIRTAASEGILAARRNLLPGGILVACGFLLVVGYYRIEAIRATLEHVVRLREHIGFLYPMISTAIFGGLIPIIIRRFLMGTRERFAGLSFYILFWAWKGVEIDFFYRFQAWLWGNGNDWITLLAKTLFDQLVYSVIVAAPSMTLAYLWKDSGFSLAGVKAALTERGLIARIVCVQISAWAIWFPAVLVIYAFPQPLQLPLANLILVIWVMLLILLTRANTGSGEGAESFPEKTLSNNTPQALGVTN